MQKLLISACLLGEKVRYDGKVIPCPHPLITRWEEEGRLLPVCPEVIAGLPVPRPPAEIVPFGSNGPVGAMEGNGEDRVMDINGEDLTFAFVLGAEKALEIALAHGVVAAILKEGSPSCGSGHIYDGTFTGRKIPGRGLTTALLAKHRIRVFSELEIQGIETFIGTANPIT